MPDFLFKQNDTGPSPLIALTDADGVLIDLAGATVRFHMVNAATGEMKVDRVINLLANTVYTANASTNTLTASEHGLINGDTVFIANVGGLPPSPLAVDTVYYVVNRTDDTLQLATSAGGSAVDLLDTGTGVQALVTGRVRFDPIAGDTDTAGDYLAECQVTFPDGSELTFPNDKQLSITIIPSLDAPVPDDGIGRGYPTLPDVKAFLSDAGVTDLSDATIQFQLERTIGLWEERTHLQPYLVEPSQTVRMDAPNGRFLDLTQPFLEITEVKTGVSATQTGIVRTLDTDYLPVYFKRGRLTCIVALDFGFLAGARSSVEITGTPGVVDSVPAEVFLAILEEAARKCLLTRQTSSAGLVAAGQVKAITQGPVKTEYTTGAEGASSSASMSRPVVWQTDFDEIVRLWRLPQAS